MFEQVEGIHIVHEAWVQRAEVVEDGLQKFSTMFQATLVSSSKEYAIYNVTRPAVTSFPGMSTTSMWRNEKPASTNKRVKNSLDSASLTSYSSRTGSSRVRTGAKAWPENSRFM